MAKKDNSDIKCSSLDEVKAHFQEARNNGNVKPHEDNDKPSIVIRERQGR